MRVDCIAQNQLWEADGNAEVLLKPLLFLDTLVLCEAASRPKWSHQERARVLKAQHAPITGVLQTNSCSSVHLPGVLRTRALQYTCPDEVCLR